MDEIGPCNERSKSRFTRGLAADPLILRLTTGDVPDEPALPLIVQSLGRLLATHGEALMRHAGEIDDLRSP
jgi:hypothetical protein